MRPSRLITLLFVNILFSGLSMAEVVDRSATGFKIKNVAGVSAPANRAYKVLVDEIGNWWDSAHTFSGDAHNLSIEHRVGGCFCERFPDGGGVHHLTIVNMLPGKRLRLSGGLGPLQSAGVSGSLTWSFADEEGGTSITLEYSVGGYIEGGMEAMAEPVDSVLNAQLQRLQNYIEHGTPVP